ncbi:hypothetical protein EDB86DRAFT_3084454 [Lactarius hatsudake]|nr:hypothetical protein EDB86DRAFT_3084454 [Lactarius hatsudake]
MILPYSACINPSPEVSSARCDPATEVWDNGLTKHPPTARNPLPPTVRYTHLELVHPPAVRAPLPRELLLDAYRDGTGHPLNVAPRPVVVVPSVVPFLGRRIDLVPPQAIATRPVPLRASCSYSHQRTGVLELLAWTPTHVRRLAILIDDTPALNTLFLQLAASPSHLEALHIVAIVQPYDLVRDFPRSYSFLPVLRESARMARGAFELDNEAER